MKKGIYYSLLAVFSLIFIVSAFFLGKYFLESHQEKSRYEQLAELVNGAQTPEKETAPDAPTEPPVAFLHPHTGKLTPVLPEYGELYLMNEDLVGWLNIPDTNINYPVMQTPDSPDYYLQRNFDKSYSAGGCLYARESCDVFAPSDNITIYGHHMRNGSMFAALSDYKSESFYQTHSQLHFDTLTEHHTYEVFSVFLTSATEGEGFMYHRFENAQSEEEFMKFVSTCQKLSFYDTGVQAQYGDKFITLSTCDYTQDNGRLVLVAKLIE